MHLKSGFDFTSKDAYNMLWGKKSVYNSGGCHQKCELQDQCLLVFWGQKKESCID